MPSPSRIRAPGATDPLWYKDAVIYEAHVRAFADSNADGMGDFPGLTSKLDYLQDLGVTAVWLLPFFPSPWRDDGYDISDYNNVHPAYGTIRDFQNFLREAHQRGLRVITEVVVNHTSDQHPWFQRARRSQPGSIYRDFYVWSNTPDKYKEARIIFKDFETSNWSFDHVAQAYFWHRFYSHQPDLNFDSPHVRQALFRVVDYWLDMGIDGFRLDAIPYLYEREGTNCENLPETHEFLKSMRAHIDSKYSGRMLLAEANQWPEDSIAYFGNDDECNMAFHFPLMPRLFMSIRMEDRYPVTEILHQTPPLPGNCQWATFLRNHDELTLEMVTDEERDYMYRVYAHDRQMRINLGIRRRLAPLLGNDRRRIELMNALLFSLPGTPVLYYGDEIGMGDNIYLGDRNGVRTPMQWSADRNAGFSRANPQKLYLPVIIDPEYHYESVNVEAQRDNANSLFWWTKHLIEQRKNFKAFSRGTLEFLTPENRKVLAFIRRFEEETILVVANLSRFPQAVQLNLGAFENRMPVEIFGRAQFPEITQSPYPLTLGAHTFYWFSLEPRQARGEALTLAPRAVPVLDVEALSNVFTPRVLDELRRLLPQFLVTRRWFLGKNRPIVDVEVIDTIAITSSASIVMAEVRYGDGEPEIYLLPVAIASGPEMEQIRKAVGDAALIRMRAADGTEGILYSALRNSSFCDSLLTGMAKRKRFRGASGEIAATHTRAFRSIWGPDRPRLQCSPLETEQANTSLLYGDRFILKLFRRVETGLNPEIEMSEFLTAHGFSHVPKPAGSLDYRSPTGETMSLGLLEAFVPNHGDAWNLTLDVLSRYYEQALTHPLSEGVRREANGRPLQLALGGNSPEFRELIDSYAETARQLGRRLAQMHATLASDPANPAFAPEPFTDHYRLGLYHGLAGRLSRVMEQLTRRLPSLPPEVQADARRVLEAEDAIRTVFRAIRDRRFETMRIRMHGDLHLSQVLYTGKDFVFIDFEGELVRPLGERRIKRSPLRDVAGMMRSFMYAADAVLFEKIPGIHVTAESRECLATWGGYWYNWVSALFLRSYLATITPLRLLPESQEDLNSMLAAYVLERALDQLHYELSDRPEWVIVPLHGILRSFGGE